MNINQLTEREKRSKERTGQQKLLLHYFHFEIETRREYQREEWSLEIREHEKEIERRKEYQNGDWSWEIREHKKEIERKEYQNYFWYCFLLISFSCA